MYDVIIIGAGPAGLSAAIYAGRAGLKTLILEKTSPGGQTLLTDAVENYPGLKKPISTQELSENMLAQAKEFGAELKIEEVIEINPKQKFQIKTNEGVYEAKTIIIAVGVMPKQLGISAEARLRARGISYCGICDAPLFKNKDIVVVGGGNTAAEETLILARFAKSIKVIHRRDKLRAAKILQERLFKNPKIEIIWNTVAEEFIGENKLEAVKIKNVKTQAITQIKAEGAFIFVGAIPQTSFLKNMLPLDPEGFIITKENLLTSIEGIFAAGDCRSSALRQIVAACAEGARAALEAEKYLAKK